jgi:hypothetical protein
MVTVQYWGLFMAGKDDKSAGKEFNVCSLISGPEDGLERFGMDLAELGGAGTVVGMVTADPFLAFGGLGVLAAGGIIGGIAQAHETIEQNERRSLQEAGIKNCDLEETYRAVHGPDSKLPGDVLQMARDPATLKILLEHDQSGYMIQFAQLEHARSRLNENTSGQPTENASAKTAPLAPKTERKI